MQHVVFIIGPGHSGSTLLGLVIGSHSQAAALGELYHLPISINADDNLCKVCQGDCPIWDDPAHRTHLHQHYTAPSPLSFMRRLFNRQDHSPAFPTNDYTTFFDWFNVRVLVDSSKQPAYINSQLNTLDASIEPVLLFCVRDGRAIVNSIHRKNRGKRSFDKSVQIWMNRIEESKRLYEAFAGRKMVVHYEQLATKSAHTAASICDLLGLTFEEAMLTYWIHDHHTVRGNAGTRSRIYAYRKQQTEDYEGPVKPHTIHDDYYALDTLAIQLDLRWKDEMPAEERRRFEELASDFNTPYWYE